MTRAPAPRDHVSSPTARWTLAGGVLIQGLLALACIVLLTCEVGAKSLTVVRVTAGEHPNFGRVVLDAPRLTYTVNRDGDHLLIRFPEDPTLGALPPVPRNVLAMREVPGGIELIMVPGAIVRAARWDTKVVIDVEDAAPNPTPVAAHRDVREGPARPDAPSTAPPVVAEPLQPTGTEPPTKSGSPAEASSKQDAAVPKQGMARSDSAASMDLTVPAPTVADALPASPSTDPGPRIPPTATMEKPTDPTGGQAASGQSPRMTPEPLSEARPEGDAAVVAQPGPNSAWPVTQDTTPSGPVALLAVKARPPGGVPGVAMRFPFTGAVGAALFSRGAESFVVFDARRPIDLSAFKDDPIFGSAVVTVYPAATVISLTRPAGQSAMLFPAQLGWNFSVVPALPKPTALTPTISNGVMTFAVDAPGQVVAITDPVTGGTLLVGTQRVSGQGVLIERRTPEFILAVTGQGIVVVPLSDAIALRITQAGYVLSGGPSGLALAPPQQMPDATMAAARLTRTFEFPGQTTTDLARRAKRQALDAAMATLLTRGPKRHALAESMLGLGLDPEAQTLLRITMKDDPLEAASPTTIGLAAIAALLANRPGEAMDLADPRLTGTDEIAMWRAIQTAMTDEGSPAAAAVLATTAPLLFTYPAEMRQRVLPLAMETMALGSQADAVIPLLAQREDDPDLDYARALAKQAQGDNDEALAMFDALKQSRSALDHARGGVRATELRLVMGKLDSNGAADALEIGLYSWRGDRRDLALRLANRRIA